jgi:FAD synthase
MSFLVFNSIEDWANEIGDDRRTIVAVGTFDGLHVGHRDRKSVV